jgi:UDP-glucose 4-epimerase
MGCRWLVTGGAGFIGSNIAAALAAGGERVRVLDNLVAGRWSNLDAIAGAALVERVTGDVRDCATVMQACKDVEVVFHEAALCSVPGSMADPIEYDRVNVGGTATVLECARKAGVRRVLLATSAAVYGDEPTLPKVETMPPAPLSPYALNKYVGECYLRLFSEAYGLETAGLRYFNVFGPNQLPAGPYAAAIPRFIDAVLRGKTVQIFGDGEQTRDFCYIDDVVRANLMVATSSRALRGEVMNVAGGRSVSINQVIKELQSRLGRDVQFEHVPARAGDIRHSLADISRVADLVGWRPNLDWEAGLAPTAAFLARELKHEAAT